MFFPLAVNYPSWIHPQIFPGVPGLGLLRWYGLMYVFAFATAFVVLREEMREGALNSEGFVATEDDIFSFIATGIVFLIIGARVFATLVYDTSGVYWKKPWLIFWPFDTATHRFTGLAGMSYHGGYIGGLFGMIVWCVAHKKPVFKWVDAMVVAIPAGYAFGRLGNFLNGELYGRITAMPWGMFFPNAERFSAGLGWVKDFALRCGMEIPDHGMVNLPRHPSQLYEAALEGLALFALMRAAGKRKKWDGELSGIYTAGYGAVRFFIEYFREPDADIGYRIARDANAPIYMNTSPLNFSTGQVLCFAMVVAGIGMMAGTYFWSKRKEKAKIK